MAAATLLAAAIASAATIQQGDLRITVLAQVKPYKLPRVGTAPIAVFVSGHLQNAKGGIPPQLQRMTIRVNKHGLLQSKGLPVCQTHQIQPASDERALANCSGALIGSGQFWANIVLPDQGAYRTQGRLLIFNGRSSCSASRHLPRPGARFSRPLGQSLLPQIPSGRAWPSRSRTQGGRPGERTPAVRDPQAADRGRRDAPCHARPEILAHIYTTHPFVSSFVIPFSIRHVAKSPYGTELKASLPQALGSWGYLDRIKLTLKRKYAYRGRQLSYFNSGCPAPKGAKRASFPLAYAEFFFKGRTPMGASVNKTCGVAS